MHRFYQKDSKQKTIAIDARFFNEAGPGRYIKNVLLGLEKLDKKNRYIVFLREASFDKYKPSNPNFKKVKAEHAWYSFDEQVLFLLKILRYSPDLFYVPHFNIPVLYPFKLVTAIPDIIMHTFSTEAGTTLPKPYFRLKKVIYRLVLRWAVVRSSKIIVPSSSVINEFVATYPKIDRGKYVLAYEGVDPDLLEARDSNVDREKFFRKIGITGSYLLYVSSMYEHKNIYRLFEALKLLVTNYDFDGQFVMVGKKDKFSQKAFEFVQNDDILKSRVIMPGMSSYVSDEQVTVLRKGALAYVFPSLKEGFSLTPMEAQIHGLPCVISDIEVHKEIYEDSVAYFDPFDIKDMAKSINSVIENTDLRKKLVQRGLDNVARFGWEKTAKVTFDVFEEVLGK